MKRFCLIAVVALLLPVAGNAATPVVSTALETNHVIAAGKGILYRLDVHSTSSSAQYILIINATSLPADGAVTLLFPPQAIAAHGDLHLTFPQGLSASTGIVVSNSSTDTFTKTIGSADCAFYALKD